MDDEDYKVSSELYEENNYISDLKPTFNLKNVVSKFAFSLPKPAVKDKDGDLVVSRKGDEHEKYVLEIEHSKSTVLNLVGLQVWRGALLLADWLIYNAQNLPQKVILELGSGVGLTSIIAAKYKDVVCTDIDKGGLLDLIRHNVKRNKTIAQRKIDVYELDFLAEKFNKDIEDVLPEVNIVLAADVVYDDTITEAFVKTISKILKYKNKVIYVALEKRFVFTLADFDSCAPCYEYFIECLDKTSGIKKELVSLDFPQYFEYERVKELVLWKITCV